MINLNILFNELENKYVFIDTKVLLNYYEFINLGLIKHFDKINKLNIASTSISEIKERVKSNYELKNNIMSFIEYNIDKINIYKMKNITDKSNLKSEVEIYKLFVELMFKGRKSLLIITNDIDLQSSLFDLNRLEIITKKTEK